MSEDSRSQTEAIYRLPPSEPIMPARFRRALMHVVPDVLPAEDAAAIGQLLFGARHTMTGVGDAEGDCWAWRMPAATTEDVLGDRAAIIRRAVHAHLDVAGAACCVGEFDVQGVEMSAQLLHHGGRIPWQMECLDHDGALRESVRLAWELTFVASPRMFAGGVRQWSDGTLAAAQSAQLVYWHPAQPTALSTVECWSAHVLHGRWSIGGSIHGPAPAGYADAVRRWMQ